MFGQPWGQKIQKPLAGRLLSFFLGGSIMTCITFFSVKQNVKDIFFDGHRRKEQQKEIDISKSINFEDIIENELDFHGYGTANIEIQQ